VLTDFVFSLFMQDVMYIPVNESSVLLSFGSTIERRIHARMMQAKQLIEQYRFVGFIETVPAYNSLAVYYDPQQIVNSEETIAETVIDQLKHILQKESIAVASVAEQSVITIPVCYDEIFGIDLQELSASLQLSIEEIIQLHTGKSYHVFMIGFTPGFPYMGAVDERLITQRKTQPRLQVPPGSVAIAGNQTGIYPFATPGGWNIIGRAAVNIFDLQKENPFLLKAGDEVKFKAITRNEFEKHTTSDALVGRDSTNIISLPTKVTNEKKQIIHIEQCGFFTTLQNTGRTDYLQFGVSKGGAMDVYAAQVANSLIGNNSDEAVLEITQSPHRFRFLQDAVVAFTGAGLQPQTEHTIIPLNQPVFISKGSVIECKQPIPGFRLYMAVAGGFEANEFLHSYSTDLLVKAGGYQGRCLQKMDELKTRIALTPLQKKLMTVLKEGAVVSLNFVLPDYSTSTIRILKGAEWNYMNVASQATLSQATFTISPQSSRMGYRLKKEALATSQPCEIISSPATQGTMQLTPSGELIILMADAQTVGGYPRVAQVCAADCSILAQKKTGDQIHFQMIDLRQAEELYLKQAEQLSNIKQTLEQMYAG
jgi:KipI family sensor histidine kinase inhibitor